jgi:hypothetical protein
LVTSAIPTTAIIAREQHCIDEEQKDKLGLLIVIVILGK